MVSIDNKENCCEELNPQHCSRCSKKEITTRKIIEAASIIFADVGFEGARVDEIAKVAGVNKATLYYNIGDKDALYAAVIHEVIGSSADKLIKEISSRKGPMEKLDFFVSAIVTGIYNNPFLPKILMREHAGGGRNFPAMVGKDFKKLANILIEILAMGKKDGVFRDVNPLILHMLIIGGISFLQTTEPVRKKYNVFEGQDNLSFDTIHREILNLIHKAVEKD